MDILIFGQVEVTADAAGNHLAQDSRRSGARYAHFGEAEQAEDHNRVEDDIDDGAGRLRDHAVDCAPGRLQQTLKSDLENSSERHAETDFQIGRPVLLHQRILDLSSYEGAGSEQAEQQKQDVCQKGQKQAVVGSLIGAVESFFAQRF